MNRWLPLEAVKGRHDVFEDPNLGTILLAQAAKPGAPPPDAMTTTELRDGTELRRSLGRSSGAVTADTQPPQPWLRRRAGRRRAVRLGRPSS